MMRRGCFLSILLAQQHTEAGSAGHSIQVRGSLALHDLSYSWALSRYLDLREYSLDDLVRHPDAPHPAAIFDDLSRRCSPDRFAVLSLLRSCNESPLFAPLVVQFVGNVLRSPHLANDEEILDAAVQASLRCKQWSFVLQLLHSHLPMHWISAATWRHLLSSFAANKMHDSVILWSLISDAKHFVGSEFQMPASVATNIMCQGGSAANLQVTPFIAHAILRRYIASAECSGQPLDSLPFAVFFTIVARVRDPETNNFYLHWRIVWRLFQKLNRSCPKWPTKHKPEEVEAVCKAVLDIASRGATPWFCLSVCRRISRAKAVNPVEIVLFYLSRITLAHHPEEAKQVAGRLFNWLSHSVKFHLRIELHPQIPSVARTLVRLDLQPQLAELLQMVVSYAGTMSFAVRQGFMSAMEAMLCPMCKSVLHDRHSNKERVCKVCLNVVPAKSPTVGPSYELTDEHFERLRQRKRQQQLSLAMRKDVNKTTVEENSEEKLSKELSRTLNEAVGGLLSEDDEPQIPLPLRRVRKSERFSKDSADNEFREKILSAPVEKLEIDIESTQKAVLVDSVQKGDRCGTHSSASPHSIPTAVTHSTRESKLPSLVVPSLPLSVAWVCVWCQEENSVNSTEKCRACGADTGPRAAWRSFAYSHRHDVMEEIRARMTHSAGNHSDAVVASYYLLIYRRAFLLLATEADIESIRQLVDVLIHFREKVLAACIYMRILPPGSRRIDKTVHYLATLFGNKLNPDELTLVEDELQHGEMFFKKVFGDSTCKVCYGVHNWKDCPIVTRNFSKQQPQISVSPAKKQVIDVEDLLRAIDAATTITSDVTALEGAFKKFVSSSVRETFAETHSDATNRFAQELSRVGQFRRAAYVCCHMPYKKRSLDTYRSFVTYFGVPVEQVELQWNSQKGGDVLNFVQLARMCCMCFEQQHPSYRCKKLHQWWGEITSLVAAGTNKISESTATQLSRSQIQAQGWLHSGPERLHTFFRFLLQHMDEIERFAKLLPSGSSNTDLSAIGPRVASLLSTAINECVQRLTRTHCRAEARRLFAQVPQRMIDRTTLGCILRINGEPESAIDEMTAAPALNAEWLSAALPPNVCFLCFNSGHRFFKCPDVEHLPPLERLTAILNALCSIRANDKGLIAAADYAQYLFKSKALGSCESIAKNVPLSKCILHLTMRCFRAGIALRGFRCMQLLPIEMTEPDAREAFWKCAGISEAAAEQNRQRLASLLSSLRADHRSPDFSSQFWQIVEQSLCRHCLMASHSIEECDLFFNEASFGRDIVSVLRVIVAMGCFKPPEAKQMLMRIAHFVTEFQVQVPFYNAAVSRAVNSLCAMSSILGERAVALRLFMLIPASYRQRHVHLYLLMSFGMKRSDAAVKVEDFLGPESGPAPPLNSRLTAAERERDRTWEAFIKPNCPDAEEALRSADGIVLQYIREHDAWLLGGKSNAKTPPQCARAEDDEILPCQYCGIMELREAFDSIQRRVEERMGMPLGSRHPVFHEAAPDSKKQAFDYEKLHCAAAQ